MLQKAILQLSDAALGGYIADDMITDKSESVAYRCTKCCTLIKIAACEYSQTAIIRGLPDGN